MRQKPPKLLYVINIPRFFVSHRLPLAIAARAAGFDVHIATSGADAASVNKIMENGFPFYPLPLSQHGMNPLRELKTLLALRKLYADLQPDLLHHVSIKPVIYGGIAARLTGGIPVIQAMSGLGYLFAGDDLKAKTLALLSQPAFRLALAGAHTRMIFQNPDDRRVFVERGLIKGERTRLIRGSGVDETEFHPRPETPSDKPVVLFAGRLLWQKGVGDFVEVARRLRSKAHFRVVGYEESTSPLNVPTAQLEAWHNAGLIEWQGKRDDMPVVYAESDIVCLPSTYGEGVPKVLIEAAACARACVATDSPGCREIVLHEDNGLLIPPRDINALAAAVERLIDDATRRRAMGVRGREIVLEGFTLRHVTDATIALYHIALNEAEAETA